MKQFWLQVTALMLVIFVGFWVSTNPTVLNGLFTTMRGNNGSGSAGNSITLGKRNTNNYQSLGTYGTKTISIVSSSGQIKAALNIEIADTEQKRALGLGQRDNLGQNLGMLFLFDSPKIPQFWMKDMRFGLDMIWINGDTVIGTQENVSPPSNTPGEVLPIYSPTQAVDKVLEVNTGFVKMHGIVAGDKLQQLP